MEKSFIQKLSDLKEIKPDSSWKAANRELLLAQVGGSGIELENGIALEKSGFSWAWFKILPQPVMVIVLAVIVFGGSGAASLLASKNSKPGDSLYIAKILNEKAQMALTFNDDKRARLGLEFAGNRAEELKAVLSDTSNSDNQEQVASLVNDFKEQIKMAKSKIGLSADQANDARKTSPVNPAVSMNGSSTEAGSAVFSAGAGKEDKGTQIYDRNEESETIENDMLKDTVAATAQSTSSEKMSEVATGTQSSIDEKVNELVVKTQELLKDQNGIDMNALEALEAQADDITTNVDAGQVKGASEDAAEEAPANPASSTVENQ